MAGGGVWALVVGQLKNAYFLCGFPWGLEFGFPSRFYEQRLSSGGQSLQSSESARLVHMVDYNHWHLWILYTGLFS